MRLGIVFCVFVSSFSPSFYFFIFLFFNNPFLQILVESMHLTAKYLDMEEKLTFTQARIMNLAIENTSLNESVKKVTVESVEVKK